MKQVVIAMLLAFGLSAGTALAQPMADKAPAEKKAAAPDSAELAAARKLGDAIGMDKQIEAGLAAMQPMIQQLAMQMQLDPAATEQLRGIFKTWFIEDCDFSSVNDKVLAMYAERFTVEELNELTAFYETPLGKKLLKEQPEIMQYSTQLGMEEGQRKQGALMQRLQPFLMQQQMRAQQQGGMQGPPMGPPPGGHGPHDGHNHGPQQSPPMQ